MTIVRRSELSGEHWALIEPRVLRERPHGEGRIKWEMWCVDGTNIRAAKGAAGARKENRERAGR